MPRPKKKPEIPPKLKAELDAMIAAIKYISTGWVKSGDSYVRSGENGQDSEWKNISEDVRALLCIDLLKVFSDAAIRTQYGRKALELLREVQDRPKVETQKLLDFYHEIEAAESRKQGFEETMDLGLEVEEPPEQATPTELLPRVVTESIAKITREAGNIPTNGDARDFSVDHERKIRVTVALTIPEEKDIPKGITLMRGRENWILTDTDLMIQDAIGSMNENGKKNWTLNDLSVMMGGTRQLSPKRRAELENMVETQRVVKFYLNWKDQLKDLKKHEKDPDRLAVLKKVVSIVDDEYLLSLQKREVTLKNGEKVIMYRTLTAPPIHEYSKHIGQVKDVPIAALNIPGVNSTSENDVIIRHLHFMVAIADQKKKPQNMLLETILERLQKKDCVRSERTKIIERITKCLEHFAGIKFIKGFETMQGARGKFTGWTIYPANKNVHALPTGRK